MTCSLGLPRFRNDLVPALRIAIEIASKANGPNETVAGLTSGRLPSRTRKEVAGRESQVLGTTGLQVQDYAGRGDRVKG
jgi:hypothetical protein